VRTAAPPTVSRLPITFGQPSVASVADRHARAFTAWLWQRRKAAWPTLRENVLLAVVGGVVLVALGFPQLLVGVALALGQVAWIVLRQRRMLARGLLERPGAHEPSTVTIDDAGIHVLGPTVAQHHGWDELGGAVIRRGFLVLEDRSRRPVEIVCLDLLGTAVDEGALLAEVRRRLA
jgi:hypothetical protein